MSAQAEKASDVEEMEEDTEVPERSSDIDKLQGEEKRMQRGDELHVAVHVAAHVHVCLTLISSPLEHGIQQADIKKLKSAGIQTVVAISMHTKKVRHACSRSKMHVKLRAHGELMHVATLEKHMLTSHVCAVLVATRCHQRSVGSKD